MKAMIATISTLVTMIGAILVGGFNFGEIRGMTNGNVEQIQSIDRRLSSVESNITELTRLTTEIATNMNWIRQSIQVSKLEKEVEEGVVAIIEEEQYRLGRDSDRWQEEQYLLQEEPEEGLKRLSRGSLTKRVL